VTYPNGPKPRNGFSLYLHIPYCQAKCPYCDFNSYAHAEWPEQGYARSLATELRMRATEDPWRGATLETIFFGGGTPSLFRPATIAWILDTIAGACAIANHVEVTLEANPGTIDRARLQGFRDAGVNRLSLGVQSFQPDLLRTLGRIHDAEDARVAIDGARAAGFDNLSMDLMFAIPGQSRAAWEADLAELVRHRPEHVSAYGLTYEPSTPFHTWRGRGMLRPLGEDDELWMYQAGRELLAAAGYLQYEISNFAVPGREARHNRGYWTGIDYLGLGAGAHSYTRLPGWGRRWSNERVPDRYSDGIANGGAVASMEALDFDTAAAEFMFLGLRELAGVDPEAFQIRFGRSIEDVHPEVTDLRRDGFLVERADRLALSERGLLVADTIFTSLM